VINTPLHYVHAV